MIVVILLVAIPPTKLEALHRFQNPDYNRGFVNWPFMKGRAVIHGLDMFKARFVPVWGSIFFCFAFVFFCFSYLYIFLFICLLFLFVYFFCLSVYFFCLFHFFLQYLYPFFSQRPGMFRNDNCLKLTTSNLKSRKNEIWSSVEACTHILKNIVHWHKQKVFMEAMAFC